MLSFGKSCDVRVSIRSRRWTALVDRLRYCATAQISFDCRLERCRRLRQRDGNMFVNRLALVVVFRMSLAVRSGDRLRRFIRLESQIALFVLVGSALRRRGRCSRASNCNAPANLPDRSPASFQIPSPHRHIAFAEKECGPVHCAPRDRADIAQDALQFGDGFVVLAFFFQDRARRNNLRAPGPGFSASAFSKTSHAPAVSPSCARTRPMFTQPSGFFGSTSVAL